MSKIATHMIGTKSGHVDLINWTKGAEYRYYEGLDMRNQLEYARKITRIEDADTRKLALELLDRASDSERQLAEAREEFKTIHTVLVKIDTLLDEEQVNEESEQPARTL